MRHLGEQRAERDDESHVVLAGDGHDLLAERAPPQLRLGADQEDDVAFAAGHGRGRHRRRRPHDLALHAFVETHLRTGRREVEEVLGIELGEDLGVPPLGQEPGRERRGLAGVVPSFEAGDQHRMAQVRAAPCARHAASERRYRPDVASEPSLVAGSKSSDSELMQ